MNAMVLAAEEGQSPLLPNGWEMLITFVGFAILLFIAYKFIVPAFEKVFRDRADAIEGGLAKAKAAQAEAKAARDEYNHPGGLQGSRQPGIRSDHRERPQGHRGRACGRGGLTA